MPEIVVKLDTPVLPTKFDVTPFKKIRPGERLEFETIVVAQAEKGDNQKKTGNLSLNFPGWGSWQIKCDEGTGAEGLGTDSAPSPLGYMSVGMAFCIMTHIKGMAFMSKFQIDDIKVEQRFKLSSTIDFTGKALDTVKGKSDGLETHIILESPEPKERIAEFLGWCEDACLALQSIVNAVPASTNLYVNGEEVAYERH